ncbi:MAG: hypothetical protein IT343_13780 [Candidatus Melainabacteria bacterium]|jgi:hypothetical protein|nr:hypothetical protein [Candidatus Melainabacteria bacterium]
MKRVKFNQKTQSQSQSRKTQPPDAAKHRHMVTQRLDESIALDSKEWIAVEQVLMRMSEFAPSSLITECVNAIAVYADEQAQQGYMLGQDDLIKQLKSRAA